MEKKTYASIDEYIVSCPVNVRGKLEEIRRIIKEAAPDAQEKISYNMPAFYQNGILVYFAASKDHLGFYPTGSGVEHFADELKSYKTSKGTIQLPYDKPLPVELIQRITRFRVGQTMSKARSKK